MPRQAASILLSVALGAAGCESYRPMDLSPDDSKTISLSAASANLAQRAENLQNPLLRHATIDPSDGYSPDELAVAAVVLNPTLAAARSRTAVADAQANQSTLLPNPTLGFTLSIPFGPRTANEVVGYGLSLDWEITALLTHGAKVAAATQIAEQGRLDVAWQEWQIAQAARQAAYDVIALRHQLTDARPLAEKLARVADHAKQALHHHDLTANDASAAEAAAGEADVAVAAAERDLADAELALRRAIGVGPQEPLPIDDISRLPSQIAVPDAAILSQHLAEHRIDLVALRSGYASQEAALRGAVLGQFPKISLGISQTRDSGDFLAAGPQFTIDLPVFDHNQGVIAIEKATRQQLFIEYHTRLFEAESDVARAVAAIRAIGRQLTVVSEQVATLQKLVSADERALQQGNLDLATYYTAASGLAQRQADQAKLQQDLMHGLITLELAAGVSLPVNQ